MTTALVSEAASLTHSWLKPRLTAAGREFLVQAQSELAEGADAQAFSLLLAKASRFARGRLAPSASERAAAAACLSGLDPERWTLLETLRVALYLAHPQLAAPAGALAVEESFRYADEGELCAGYRVLALLPAPERFRWRAGEGCRSNMRTVFEACVCDTPYASLYFDEIAWRQALVKALFVGAPLWRVFGLDARLDADLARMVLDLAEERRSAGRPVPHELWLCLGAHGGARALASIRIELDAGAASGRAAALCALARAGAQEQLAQALVQEADARVLAVGRQAQLCAPGAAFFRGFEAATWRV